MLFSVLLQTLTLQRGLGNKTELLGKSESRSSTTIIHYAKAFWVRVYARRDKRQNSEI